MTTHLDRSLRYARLLDRGVDPQAPLNASARFDAGWGDGGQIIVDLAGTEVVLLDCGDNGFISSDGRYLLLEPMRTLKQQTNDGVEISHLVPYPPPRTDTLCKCEDLLPLLDLHVAEGVRWANGGWVHSCAAHGGSTYEAWPPEAPSAEPTAPTTDGEEHEFDHV